MADQQQPIVIQSGGGTSPVTALITVAAIGVGVFFGHRFLVKRKSQKEAGNLDTPETQAASKIYSAKNWYGDSPQTAFDAAKQIASNKISWKGVADSFKKLYNENIDDYLNFLSPEEKAQFFNILNLTQDKETKFTGKPPVKATLQFDVINNYCYAVATKGTNIRKSPEIIGKGGLITVAAQAIPKLGQNNIIAVAEINQPLGMMTGEYKLSSDGKTAFVEFYGQVWGTDMQLKKVWVAASNIKVVSFNKKTAAARAKLYNIQTQFLKIKKFSYDWARS